MFNSPDSISTALEHLSELMEAAGDPAVGLLVCGGSALNVLGLVRRSTRDVDVICVAEDDEGQIRFVKEERLPIRSEIIDAIASDLGLPMTDGRGTPLPDDQKWINLGPQRLLDFGLPEGIERRLTKRLYGTRLTIFFIGREDQIFLKLYACLISHREMIHLQDLIKLKPSETEIEAAVVWLTGRSISQHHRKKLREALWNLEYVYIADKFDL